MMGQNPAAVQQNTHQKVIRLKTPRRPKKKPPQRIEALAELLRGTPMMKFPRKCKSAPHLKFVQLTRSKTALYLQWFSKKKPLKSTAINIADMDRVEMGSRTSRFSQQWGNSSFSIKYNGTHSLDLQAKSAAECTMWVLCLREFIKRANSHNLLTIEKIWIKNFVFIDTCRPKRELENVTIVRP